MRKLEYVMTSDLTSCRPNNNLAEVGALMWEHNCGAVPVMDSYGRVVGMITDRDICIALTTRNQPAANILVEDVMSKKLHLCSLEDSIEDVIEKMQKAKVRRIIVVGKENRLKGLITMSDILMRLDKTSSAAIILKAIYEDIKPLAVATAK